jgi:DNA polymerase-3 subunit beta
MQIKLTREALLPALQAVANVVERRQTLPILSNVLLTAENGRLHLLGTDMEVEVSVNCEAAIVKEGATTVPARKLLDICRSLPADASVQIETGAAKVKIQSGRSRFLLATLPPSEFPSVGTLDTMSEFPIAIDELRDLIGNTQFAMAHQDVRYYLNGLLLELSPNAVRAVATDGHRLALCDRELATGVETPKQIIVPRKGVTELVRMLGHLEGEVSVGVGQNHLKVTSRDQSVTTKLIDGKFPDYERVIPKEGEKLVTADREALKAAFGRTSILSNEKFRGVRISLTKGLLKAAAHNPEQEEAEEDIEVDYTNDDLEIGFNVSYLLDVLGVLKSQNVRLELSDANSSCVLYAPEDTRARYVIMPMRL